MATVGYLTILLVFAALTQVFSDASNSCANFGCLNGGICGLHENDPYCSCPAGYSGLKCETMADGRCPEIIGQSGGACLGTQCTSDSNCTKDQICCMSSCGSNVCTSTQTNRPKCSGGCPLGYKCENQPLPCPSGQTCTRELVPICVAPNDMCAGCPDGQFCKDTGILCKNGRCPTYQCVTMDACGGCPKRQRCEKVNPPCPPPPPCNKNSTENCIQSVCQPVNYCVPDLSNGMPKDACGKCPSGQACRPTRIVCTDETCPSYECVSLSVYVPAVSCNMTCGDNYVCQYKVPDCPMYNRENCGTRPKPQCIPRQKVLGSCPEVTQTDASMLCMESTYKHQCSNDLDCNRSKERCCPARCNRMVCTNVSGADITP